MKIKLTILTFILLTACDFSANLKKQNKNSAKKNDTPIASDKSRPCDYIKYYIDLGNKKMDTIKIRKRLVDPIDNFKDFEQVKFGFVQREGKIYKKARTHHDCGKQMVDVEFYQDLSDRIELSSYKEYDKTFFSSKNQVNFWWVNSGGHLIIPIEHADPKTFKPFDEICGGYDHKEIYYGCPNRGVYRLNIPKDSKYTFIAKENNYWNSPKHYVIVDNKVYDIKYEYKKGYFCQLDESLSKEEILKTKK